MKRLALGIGRLVLLWVIPPLSACGSNATKPAATATRPAVTAAAARIATSQTAVAGPGASAASAAPSVSPSPSPTPKPSQSPTPSPTPVRTPSPAPKPTAPSFGSGTKRVGTDIQPGTYRARGGSGCYWERESGFSGSLSDILANENPAGPTLVTIAPTDKGFKSHGCGTWTQDLSPITSSPTAPFEQGTYIVNKDIAPGTWQSSGGDGCYWARLRGFSGSLHDIIANDNTNDAAIVQIAPTDAGFSSERCGTWTKVG